MKSSNLPFPRTQQNSQTGDFWRRWGGLTIGAVALAVLIGVVWYLLAGTASTKREVAATPMLMLPPEPIKPPEPEKLPDPPPEKVKPEVQEPKPSPVESPKDQAPTPSRDVADPLTMNADAQAGDSGILAGSGGGMVGGGGMAGSFASYISNAMQRALANDPRSKQLAFGDINVDVWMDLNGKVTRVVLVKGSGSNVDDQLLVVLNDFRSDERPSPNIRYPMHISIKGRRP